jgi:amino acid adenylation domain-containing protein
LGQRHGTTLFMTLLAAWAALLSRLSGQHEVVIGTPVAGRTRLELEPLIGMFVNTQALRVNLAGAATLGELLAQVRRTALAAQAHQDVPFEQVVETLKPQRSLAHSPFFQVMLAWQNTPQGDLRLPGLQLQAMDAHNSAAQFDLSLSLQEAGVCITGEISYATALFDAATIERHIGHWKTLLQAMVQADADQPVDRLSLLSPTERYQVLFGFNDTAAVYPSERCIHELFEEQAARTPEAVALIFEDATLSYGELNERANRLAHHLIELGVKPDERVAVALERGIDMVVALLATLKAGGAYVPLDSGYPQERLAFMLQDSAPKVLLTSSHVRTVLGQLPAALTLLNVDSAQPSWMGRSHANPDPAVQGLRSSHLAYVIYTSGSTGQPKGVMVEHAGLCNLVTAHIERICLRQQSRVLQFASVAFDVCVEEVFGTLAAGATLILRSEAWLAGAQEFWTLCEQYQVSVVDLSMLFWEQCIHDAHPIAGCVKQIIVGGEAVSSRAMQAWFQRGGHRPRLLNAYGPTETTVNATMHEPRDTPDDWRVIGRPIANTSIYILDTAGQPVPVGVAGELYIGGAGVARGYLNRPELTEERFGVDPFAREAGLAHARMYKTGDLGRWLADGTIEFLGRNDYQVKIRGFRIELGEIEARLAQHAGVKEAVVLARQDSVAEKRLVAYYTLAQGQQEADAEALRAHVLQALPEYMVPAAYVRLEQLPLTPNGKLDRKALPAPEGDVYASKAYEAPQGPIEESLARIWQELLKVERVGRNDNFFELGGHSLLAMRLINRCSKSGLTLSVSALFAHPTLHSLAACIRDNVDVENFPLPLRTTGKEAPLFLLPVAIGPAVAYIDLTAQIDPEVPVYCLASPPPTQAPFRTFQAAAARYVTMIRKIQARGPYRLAGWSLGGMMAYEVATQLLGENETVEYLALFDTSLPDAVEAGRDARPELSDIDWLIETLIEVVADPQQAQQLRQRIAELPGDAGLSEKRQVIHDCGLLVGSTDDMTVESIQQLLKDSRAVEKAMDEYVPQPIPVRMHLFAAEESVNATQDPQHSLLGWEALLPREQISKVVVPGKHISLMDAPWVKSLGHTISQKLRCLSEPTPSAPYRALYTIRAGVDTAAPIFCVPGAGDGIMAFAPLADALAPQCSLHGLQPRGLTGSQVPHASVEAAARCYVKEMLECCPSGQCHLVGHSFGGWVVFEMAEQLRQRGSVPLSVTMIDTDAPRAELREYTRIEALLKLIKLFELRADCPLDVCADELQLLSPDAQIALVHRRLKTSGLISVNTKPDDLGAIYRTFSTNLRTSYRPQAVCDQPIHLVWVSAGSEPVPASAEPWRAWAPELRLHRAQGNHVTLLQMPDVADLARWLQDGPLREVDPFV